jgi:magnesium-transporting ATPase (P-type)
MIDAIEKGKESENTLEVYRKAIMHAKIYARMSPDHKAMLVEELQNNMKEMIGM